MVQNIVCKQGLAKMFANDAHQDARAPIFQRLGH